MSLLVIGTVAFDAIETPFGKTDKIVGGAASFISLAASYYYPDIHLVSVVGDDYDQNFLKLLQSKGIDLSGLQVKKGEKSFFWKGKYHIDMNSRDTLDTQLNVLSSFDPIVPEKAKNAEFVMLGNLMPSLQMKVLNQLSRRPKLIMMDTMNFWMQTAMDDLKKVLSEVDILTINDEEARLLTNTYSLKKAAKDILKMGPKILIIKKGEHGALLFHDNEVFFAPALPLEEVFDPTGAGDSFAGGMIGYLSRTKDLSFENLKRAIIVGSAMASFTVEKFGTEALQNLTPIKIHNRIQEFVKLSSFEMKFELSNQEV
ncbi:MAG TPA: PfkB family carbohydrate kinase [Bacteroidia bacterium]|nr:PfkB family carbohydrate kinase [Bacteroidia bacterium]